MTASPSFDAGSFRDKNNRVFYQDGRVLRALSPEARDHWQTLQSKDFFEAWSADGRLIRTRSVNDPPPPSPDPTHPWVAVLEHGVVPFISYPYEWSFGMHQAAALLQLDLLEAALGEGMLLKDATPYNVQWIRGRPVFIDIPSLVAWKPGTPWTGYQQFCQLYLYPLLLQSLRGVDFRPWLRGAIDGISSDQMRGLVSWQDAFRPGVLAHVLLHAHLQTRYAGSQRHVRQDLARSGFSIEMIQANVRGLKRVVQGFSWRPKSSEWSDYADQRNYSSADYEAKKTFVRKAVADRAPGLVWDLGCNTGDFSEIAAEKARQVVSMDGDAWVIEGLYQRLKSAGRPILPLVMNLADPSPGLGWGGQERKALSARGRPDLILCLALMHHLAISANIPIDNLIAWLADLGADLVIEFVDAGDEMVQRLLRNKEGRHEDYTQANFEAILMRYFAIKDSISLNQGGRRLYSCKRV